MEHTVLLAYYSPGVRKGSKLKKPGAKIKFYLPRVKVPETSDLRQQFRVSRALWARHEDRFRQQLQKLWSAYEAGNIDQKQLYATFSEQLYRAQVKAYLLGRQAVGNYATTLSLEERRYLHGQHSAEMKFFKGFMRDLAAGRGRMPYRQRIDLYGLGLHSIYQRAAVMNVANAEAIRWRWVMHPEAEHCPTCVKNDAESRALGGYTLPEIVEVVGFPGEKTICGNRCRCHLEPVTGVVRLKRTRPTAYAHVVGNR